ncbi:exodeoxyribonuclease III [Proteiniclasticum sp. SCR006]|uniref:Exodeoxyribonuclease III n=1 Tax=Proteiniclasticum aestuarii TaxID=2817862 RepID=A0A939H781_9CLOT|nr:exodeoxyribonuclease III [Proteiniclasticum aestuarii]MBO1263749.1 exodeoxyribonuclease III [Proteiniclasticum aestuarii]
MKIVSWNVNGLRAIMKKGFKESVMELDPDILFIQETKMQEDQLVEEIYLKELGYTLTMHSGVRKGYSSVAVYTRIPVDEIIKGSGIEEYDAEGRVIQVNVGDYAIFGIYFPNGGRGEERLAYKMRFYDDLLVKFDALKESGKKVIITGDFNVAHNEIDLANPETNQKTSGFLPIERDWFTKLLSHGYVDAWRARNPEEVKYTWWDQRFRARDRNAGWRIDYFVVSENVLEDVDDLTIYNDIMGSDHCPLSLTLKGE